MTFIEKVNEKLLNWDCKISLSHNYRGNYEMGEVRISVNVSEREIGIVYRHGDIYALEVFDDKKEISSGDISPTFKDKLKELAKIVHVRN